MLFLRKNKDKKLANEIKKIKSAQNAKEVRKKKKAEKKVTKVVKKLIINKFYKYMVENVRAKMPFIALDVGDVIKGVKQLDKNVTWWEVDYTNITLDLLKQQYSSFNFKRNGDKIIIDYKDILRELAA